MTNESVQNLVLPPGFLIQLDVYYIKEISIATQIVGQEGINMKS
jgi:hypothetical protein